MRIWMLVLASAALSLGTLELAIRQLDLFAPARAALAQAGRPAPRPADAPANNNQLHPFRGWSVRPNAPPKGAFEHPGHRNRFGFTSTIDDYRSVDEADFAIGIFGGSVAAGVATWGGDEIARVLARARPELASKIRILNFGSASYKQPQQLMILSEMILLGVSLDYVVNVDGLNEATIGGKDALAGHHPLFPARTQMQMFAEPAGGAPTDAFYLMSAQIIGERNAAERIESLAAGWLSHSELARALAGVLTGRHRRRAWELEAGLQAARSPRDPTGASWPRFPTSVSAASKAAGG